MMLHGYCMRGSSSWRIATRLHEAITCRVLAANNSPAPYQVRGEMSESLRRAQEVDEVDEEEGRRYGRDNRGDELLEELAFLEDWLEKINGYRSLICTGHNLLKLFRFDSPSASPAPPVPQTA